MTDYPDQCPQCHQLSPYHKMSCSDPSNTQRGERLTMVAMSESVPPNTADVLRALQQADKPYATACEKLLATECRRLVRVTSELEHSKAWLAGEIAALRVRLAAVSDSIPPAPAAAPAGHLPAWDQSDGVWCEKHQEDATLCACPGPQPDAPVAQVVESPACIGVAGGSSPPRGPDE